MSRELREKLIWCLSRGSLALGDSSYSGKSEKSGIMGLRLDRGATLLIVFFGCIFFAASSFSCNTIGELWSPKEQGKPSVSRLRPSLSPYLDSGLAGTTKSETWPAVNCLSKLDYDFSVPRSSKVLASTSSSDSTLGGLPFYLATFTFLVA